MKSLMMVAVAALACAAFADGPREGGRRQFGGPRDGMMPPVGDPIVRMVSNPKSAEKLGLSDEQKAKLQDLQKDAQSAREAQKKVRDAMIRQADLLKADKIDEAAVMKTIDEVFELRKEMAKDQAKRLIAVKSILTPEQVKIAHDEMAKFAGDRGPRRGGDRPARGPREDGDRPAPVSEVK